MQQTTNVKRASRAEYQAQRRLQSVTLYFRSVEDLAAHQRAAEASGYASFNGWVLQMLANATSGSIFPPEYVEGLRKEVEKLRSWLDAAREEATESRREVKTLQAERETLMTLLHGTAGGPEAVQAFLEQSAQRRGF